jgi:hypothetical protein
MIKFGIVFPFKMIHKQFTFYSVDQKKAQCAIEKDQRLGFKMIHEQYTLNCIDPQKGTVCHKDYINSKNSEN